MRSFDLPRRLAHAIAACLLTAVLPSAVTADAATVASRSGARDDPAPAAGGDLTGLHAGRHGVRTPPSWMAMALPGVRGHIQAVDSDDSVQFMYNDERKLGGLVMVTVTPGGGYASVIKTFTLDQANPPQLQLLAPGAYTPLCHPGHACSAIHAEHQVISLCFGEASCRILYYENQQLRETVMTD